MDTSYRIATAWGDAVVTWNGSAVTSMTPPDGGHRSDVASIDDANVMLRDFAATLTEYFDGEAVELVDRAVLETWLDAAGVTGARRAMALTLFDVPRGVTLSYGELASLAGYPGAARAAGSMCARNPLPVVVPCHRVVHAGARPGDVGSYGAATGSAYKRRLLELENASLVRRVPT